MTKTPSRLGLAGIAAGVISALCLCFVARDVAFAEMAPAAANRDIFVDKEGKPIKGEGSSTIGYRASGVPGTPVATRAISRPSTGPGLPWW